MLPTITLTLRVKKRDGLNAWSGKTTTISAMMARIISRKMSHNLIFGVNAVDAYLVGPYSSVYRAPRTAANRQRFHHYELRLFWRGGAGVDRQHVLPTQTPRRIGRHGVTQSVIGLISRGLSCAADSHVPVFGPFEPMMYSPRVMSQARAMGDLGATQFNLQRRAMRHPSQCSYLVCDGRLPVALVVW